MDEYCPSLNPIVSRSNASNRDLLDRAGVRFW